VSALTTAQDTTLHSIQELEKDRSSLRQISSAAQDKLAISDLLHKEESAQILTLQASLTTLETDLASARTTLEAEVAKREVAERNLESTAEELAKAKNEVEVEQARSRQQTSDAAAAAEKKSAADTALTNGEETSDKPAKSTLDQEFLDSLHTQHALDLSTARSQIRSLETSLYTTEQRAITSERSITDLQSQLSILQHTLSQAQARESLSVATPSMSRRSSGNNEPQKEFEPLSKRAVDADLPPASRHARRVSLSMLKARMDLPPPGTGGPLKSPALKSPAMEGLGEAAEDEEAENEQRRRRDSNEAFERRVLALGVGAGSAVTAGGEENGSGDMVRHKSHNKVVPQFSDAESVVWCSCCEGDLIVI
jgi:chromosome segregation ATPase